MSRPKISIIGAGNIGGTLAHIAVMSNIADIVLLDKKSDDCDKSAGKLLDIQQSSVIYNDRAQFKATSNPEDIANSDVIIVTAGVARTPGMSRDDLLSVNVDVIKSIGQSIKKYAADSFVIVVTNPLDVMTYAMQKVTGMPRHKLIGMAGILDSTRFIHFLSQKLNISAKDINALVLGGHGDTMVPITRYCSIAGVPLSELIKMKKITQEEVNEVIVKTRKGGEEIVNLLGKGSAFVAPAHCAFVMAKSYLLDSRRMLPCSVRLEGEYGVNDGLYVGVPIILGKNGVEEVMQMQFTDEEMEIFMKSVSAVRDLTQKVDKMLGNN